MVKAYVLVHVQPGAGKRVTQEVTALKGVVSANYVTGPYDVIAVVEARDLGHLGSETLRKIQSIDGVLRTLTCPSLGGVSS